MTAASAAVALGRRRARPPPRCLARETPRKSIVMRERLAKIRRIHENLAMIPTCCRQDIDDAGFVVVPAVFSNEQVDAITAELQEALAGDATGSTLRTADGTIYGARNLIHLWPAVADVWKQPLLVAVLKEVLGLQFGLVRVLYFNKPPEQSWALPWHKDRAIAVRDNRLSSKHFSKPTFKIGVPHVDAPDWLLETMLTLRLHLDDMTAENGPLQVLPGSHRGVSADRPPFTILGQRGDVLLMRPLLSHSSNVSLPETTQHRRILHYEFSGIGTLPDGFAWHDFIDG